MQYDCFSYLCCNMFMSLIQLLCYYYLLYFNRNKQSKNEHQKNTTSLLPNTLEKKIKYTERGVHFDIQSWATVSEKWHMSGKIQLCIKLFEFLSEMLCDGAGSLNVNRSLWLHFMEIPSAIVNLYIMYLISTS